MDKHTNYTCGPKLYRPIWLWAEIDMGRNCNGPKCPVTVLGHYRPANAIWVAFDWRADSGPIARAYWVTLNKRLV